MKGTKQQWEFPQKQRTTQNLVDNARLFEKEILGPEEDAYLQIQKNMNWATEIKTKLLKIDNKKQSKGR